MHLFNLAFWAVGRDFIFGKWEIVHQGYYPFLIPLHSDNDGTVSVSRLGQLPSRFCVKMGSSVICVRKLFLMFCTASTPTWSLCFGYLRSCDKLAELRYWNTVCSLHGILGSGNQKGTVEMLVSSPWCLGLCFCLLLTFNSLFITSFSIESRGHLRVACHSLGIGRRHREERGRKPWNQCKPEQNKINTTVNCFMKGTILAINF